MRPHPAQSIWRSLALWLLMAGLIGAATVFLHPRPFLADPMDDAFARSMTDSMTKMAQDAKATPMSGSPDHDFAAMMIVHHLGAVEMAQAELLHGRDPVLRRLAQEIVVTQSSEIAVLRGQLGKEDELCP